MADKKIEIKDIPVMPQVATKILLLKEENLEISFKELGNIILLDPALTTKILKVSNSALYARQREIINLQQAITLLGFQTVKSLVLLICASNIFGKLKRKNLIRSGLSKTRSSEVDIWRHLVLTAFVAKNLATKLQYDQKKEDMFIAGMLHDIGRIVLLMNDYEGYNNFLEIMGREPERDILAIEESIFGYDHAEVGKNLLQKWNFPEELIDTVYQHHSGDIDSPHRKMVLIVALANIYSRILVDEPLPSHDIQMKEDYIKALSLAQDIDEYFTMHFLEDIKGDDLFNMSSDIIK
ncbi:MAG: HDOD domain-containing protein [Spirochaetota bacterium]|nr:HDOD domain-containing protein [Spirochaetota bacterium]